jgi:hypothetical protein
LWLFAILAAASAPLCVRLYASALQKQARKRTERALALADLEAGSPHESQEDTKEVGG